MKKILVISSSRADRHLLEPVSIGLGDDCEFITGTPLSWECCRSKLNEDDAGKKVVLLGDRWETLLLAFRAIELNCLCYHIHGGEETFGSKDNIYRRAISALSHVHLTAHKQFSDRIIRMGENPANVICVGALGVYRAKKINDAAFPIQTKTLTVILHPNTIEPGKTEGEVSTLLNALKSFTSGFRIKFYAPNHDSGREIIINKIGAFIELYGGEYVVEEFGDDFLNSLKHSACIIGNSSCGIIEAPTLLVPTINIGSRQEGRPMALSIINTDFDSDVISAHIRMVISMDNIDYTNPYDNTEGDTVDMICDIVRNHPVSFQKRFIDV